MVFSRFDPLGWGHATAVVAQQTAFHPADVAKMTGRLVANLARLPAATLERTLGVSRKPPVEVDQRDRRFADPAWESNPALAYPARSARAALTRRVN